MATYTVQATRTGQTEIRTYEASSPDEALTMSERQDSATADFSYALVCDCCGEPDPTVTERPDGMAECLRCWRSALQHGHLHGLHTDADADPTDPTLDDCPDCPTMAERVRIAALRDDESR